MYSLLNRFLAVLGLAWTWKHHHFAAETGGETDVKVTCLACHAAPRARNSNKALQGSPPTQHLPAIPSLPPFSFGSLPSLVMRRERERRKHTEAHTEAQSRRDRAMRRGGVPRYCRSRTCPAQASRFRSPEVIPVWCITLILLVILAAKAELPTCNPGQKYT